MNPTDTATQLVTSDRQQSATQVESPRSFHTFITKGPRGATEYAILPEGTIRRLTPKPLNKKQRRKLFRQSNAANV